MPGRPRYFWPQTPIILRLPKARNAGLTHTTESGHLCYWAFYILHLYRWDSLARLRVQLDGWVAAKDSIWKLDVAEDIHALGDGPGPSEVERDGRLHHRHRHDAILGVAGGRDNGGPRTGVLVAQVDEDVTRAGRLEGGVERFHSCFAETGAAVVGRVANMQHHVRDGVVGKLGLDTGQLQGPVADGASTLKGHVALVAEAQLELAGVVDSRRRGNGLDGHAHCGEPGVLGGAGAVLGVASGAEGRVYAIPVAVETEHGADRGVGPHDTRNAHRDAFDAAEVVAGEIEVVDGLGDGKVAGVGLAKGHERDGVELAQRDVLDQLKVVAALALVGRLELFEGVGEAFAAQQAVVRRVPVGGLQVVGHVARALVLEGAHGFAGQLIGMVVGVLVEPGHGRGQVVVQLGAGELGAEVLVVLGGVGHLALLACHVLLGQLDADTRRQDLSVDVLELEPGLVELQVAVVDGPRAGGFAAGARGVVGDGVGRLALARRGRLDGRCDVGPAGDDGHAHAERRCVGRDGRERVKTARHDLEGANVVVLGLRLGVQIHLELLVAEQPQVALFDGLLHLEGLDAKVLSNPGHLGVEAQGVEVELETVRGQLAAPLGSLERRPFLAKGLLLDVERQGEHRALVAGTQCHAGLVVPLLARGEQAGTQGLDLVGHVHGAAKQPLESVVGHWPADGAEDARQRQALGLGLDEHARVDGGVEEGQLAHDAIDVLRVADLEEAVVDVVPLAAQGRVVGDGEVKGRGEAEHGGQAIEGGGGDGARTRRGPGRGDGRLVAKGEPLLKSHNGVGEGVEVLRQAGVVHRLDVAAGDLLAARPAQVRGQDVHLDGVGDGVEGVLAKVEVAIGHQDLNVLGQHPLHVGHGPRPGHQVRLEGCPAPVGDGLDVLAGLRADGLQQITLQRHGLDVLEGLEAPEARVLGPALLGVRPLVVDLDAGIERGHGVKDEVAHSESLLELLRLEEAVDEQHGNMQAQLPVVERVGRRQLVT
ncbi:hypothetical protein ColTof4_14396 [Colletotrichum tofieldiae]|nr:hypothetical protein ColTof3_14885 [Colletotrichum tofieldiae]GKT81973.1 hypothetical protein ColTof4_14396 [Colletotrichum tofieldiae]